MAYTEFYLDPAASGASDTNGGGSTSAPTSYTVSTDAGGTTVTSTVGNIGALAAGTWVYIDNNGTAAWRRVTSPNGSTQITVSPALTGSMTGKTAKSGGAFLTFRGACNALASIGSANWPTADAASPPRLNVKTSGTYTETSAIATLGTWATAVSSTQVKLFIEAYSSTPGDLNHWTGTTRATVTNSSTDLFTAYGTGIVTRSMNYVCATNNTTTFVIKSAGNNVHQCMFLNCKFSRTTGNAYCITTGATNAACFIRCYFEKTASGAADVFATTGANNNMIFVGCEFVGASNAASQGSCFHQVGTAGSHFRGCIFRNATNGIFLESTPASSTFAPTTIDGCGFYALQKGITGSVADGVSSAMAWNNAFDTVVTCIDNTSGTNTRFAFEDFNACLSNRTTFVDTNVLNVSPNNLDAVAAVFTAPGSGDFTLASTSTLGGAGFPGYGYAGTTGYRGYKDIGVFQRSGNVAASTYAGDASVPYPIYGAQYTVTFPIKDSNDALKTGATVTSQKYMRDVTGGASTDLSGTVTETATSGGIYTITLNDVEMTSAVTQCYIKATSAKDVYFEVRPKKLPVILTGTASAGASGTITLDSNASTTNDFYKGMIVVCRKQARMIDSYTGSTKVASLTASWGTNNYPTYGGATDTYTIYKTEFASASAGVTTADLPANFGVLAIDASGRMTAGAILDGAIKSTTFDTGAIGSVSDITNGTVTALQAAQPSGQVTGATNETIFTVDGLNSSQANNWAGAYLLFTSGALAGQIKKITASTAVSAGNTTLTTDAFTAKPVVTATYRIINGTV